MDPTHEMPIVSADPDPASLLEPDASEAPETPEAPVAVETPTASAPATDATAADEPPAGVGYRLWSDAQKALFALMAIALFVLLIGLAANADSGAEPPPPPEPQCWAFDDDCCIEEYGWDECCDWYDRRDDRGLFDAEERFVDEPPQRDSCW